MTMQIETNEGSKKEAKKDEMSGAWPLWLMALSPFALSPFAMLLLGIGFSANGLFLMLCTSASAGIIAPCVLIYFSWQRHFVATNTAVLLLLLNIVIALFAFGILSEGG